MRFPAFSFLAFTSLSTLATTAQKLCPIARRAFVVILKYEKASSRLPLRYGQSNFDRLVCAAGGSEPDVHLHLRGDARHGHDRIAWAAGRSALRRVRGLVPRAVWPRFNLFLRTAIYVSIAVLFISAGTTYYQCYAEQITHDARVLHPRAEYGAGVWGGDPWMMYPALPNAALGTGCADLTSDLGQGLVSTLEASLHLAPGRATHFVVYDEELIRAARPPMSATRCWPRTRLQRREGSHRASRAARRCSPWTRRPWSRCGSWCP